MTIYVALLRGINVGTTKRMAMPRLREVLEAAGFEDVATYVQSGNVVLRGSGGAAKVGRGVEQVIEGEWGFEVPVVVRTKAQLQAVVDHSPFADEATEPKFYSVTFFPKPPPTSLLDDIEDAQGPDLVELHGSELYLWSPQGISNSKLAALLGRRALKLSGTGRNWRTVEQLLSMCGEEG
jgi:uncharacterized protein (DUF1697 family)